MLRSTLLLVLLWIFPTSAAEHSFHISVEAGKVDRKNTPVFVPVKAPKIFYYRATVTVTDAAGKSMPGQLVYQGNPRDKEGDLETELVFVLPQLAAGEKANFAVTLNTKKPIPNAFRWVDASAPKDVNDDYAQVAMDLRLGDRPLLRYMYSGLDESTKESRSATMKPYHHLFDPDGKRLVTKGPGGLFPHHRGLFFGFNKITYGPDGKKQADTWHCNNGEYQWHAEFLGEDSGAVYGRHGAQIYWRGRDREVFAEERRYVTAYDVPDATLVQFETMLKTTGDPIKLDGDPQHAGFQFRAAQDVPDKTKDKTWYLRPDGKGEPGKFRNWPADKQHVNLPWLAMSFVIEDQRYTCCYLDHPDNPKEARFSERDYGRFGSYFEYTVDKDRPLNLKYRIWLQKGEMTVEEVQRLSDDFVHPVIAKVE